MDPIPLVQRVDYLKEICRGKSVLHLGCTDWPYTQRRLAQGDLLHLELRRITECIWGLDGDQGGLDMLAQSGIKDILQGNLECLDSVELDRTFDVVLAGEVLEHLSNPGLFLHGVQRFMRPDGLLVITTINAYCGFRMFRYFLRGKGGIAEPVHPDHVAYYSYSTLIHLLARENLSVKRFYFYDLGREHRPYHLWYLNWFNDVCVGLARHLADGLIAECKIIG